MRTKNRMRKKGLTLIHVSKVQPIMVKEAYLQDDKRADYSIPTVSKEKLAKYTLLIILGPFFPLRLWMQIQKIEPTVKEYTLVPSQKFKIGCFGDFKYCLINNKYLPFQPYLLYRCPNQADTKLLRNSSTQ